MQRIRTIKPEFFVSDDVVPLTFGARLLFIGLWTCADREGRLEDQPGLLKRQLFPDQPVDIAALLAELDDRGVIQRYERDAKRCIWIINFKKHQCPNLREKQSILPPPPDPPPSPQLPDLHVHARARTRGASSARGEREREREEEGNTDLLRASAEERSDPTVSVFRSSESAGEQTKRGWRRVPPHEQLTPERLAMGREIGLLPTEIRRAWDAFVDHDFPRPYVRVDATWRNWLRKERPARAVSPASAVSDREEAKLILRSLA
jgi:hypothetical protein